MSGWTILFQPDGPFLENPAPFKKTAAKYYPVRRPDGLMTFREAQQAATHANGGPCRITCRHCREVLRRHDEVVQKEFFERLKDRT